MTRLARHDEIVESLQKRIIYELGIISDDAARDLATAALDALLTAVVELGVGEVFPFEAPHKPCIVLQLEDKPRTAAPSSAWTAC